MDRETFDREVAVYRDEFYRLALRTLADRADAEDVAQETLLRLWEMRERLDSYGSVRMLGLTMARNRCIDMLRRVRPVASIEELSGMDSGIRSAEQIMIDKDVAEHTSALLALLPEGQRKVLKMRHIDGMETSEIAIATGIREATVRVALSRARNRLKQLFLNEESDE